MTGPWVSDVAELVADVPSGAAIGVSGFHFTRVPVAQLLALADAGVTGLDYVSWGGGLPLEILLGRGMVDRATLCFSSLDVLGPAPRFRRAVESGQLTLSEWTALGMISGLRAAAENLAFEVLQEPAGSSLAASFSRPVADYDPLQTATVPMVAVPPLPLDVFLLHAQRADDDGNVEIAGARGLDLSTIFASRRVLVTVEERVRRGELGDSRSFIVPRTFVSRLALAPSGAYPTSCLPHYPADYRALRAGVDASPDAPVPEAALRPEPGRMAVLTRRAAAPAQAVSAALREVVVDEPPPGQGRGDQATSRRWAGQPPDDRGAAYTVDELIVAVLARTIEPAGICSFGSASALPSAAYFLAKHLWAPDLLLMSHNGGLVDVPVRPLTLAASEQLDHELAAAHTGGDETYHWYYQRGLITHEVVGSAQVDGYGATNNLWVRKSDGTPVRLPGQGGMADVANLHANFMIYLPRQSPRNTPARVETVSAQRVWHDPEQRRRYGLRPGRTLVVSDLAVFEYDAAVQRLTLRSLHPGVTVAELEERTGFEIVPAAEVTTTAPPSSDELRALRTVVDPLGIRRLDMVSAADRQKLIDQILDLEESVLDALSDVE